MTQNTETQTTPGGYDPQDIEQNKVVSGLAYFGILFFLPLVAAPNSKYGRFHANQGLLMLLLCIAVAIVLGILGVILAFIWLPLYFVLSTIVWIAIAVLFVIGLINGFSGKVKELPIIGKLRIIK